MRLKGPENTRRPAMTVLVAPLDDAVSDGLSSFVARCVAPGFQPTAGHSYQITEVVPSYSTCTMTPALLYPGLKRPCCNCSLSGDTTNVGGKTHKAVDTTTREGTA